MKFCNSNTFWYRFDSHEVFVASRLVEDLQLGIIGTKKLSEKS